MLQEGVIDNMLSDNEVTHLSAPFNQDKILNTPKHVKGRKSPSTDGLHACFNHKYWPVLGENISKMVIDILNNDEDISASNDAFIILVPN